MSVTWGGQSVSINTGATGSPVGAAGGDLDGAYPNPTVDGLQGRPVASTAPTAGQALVWSGSAWAPGSVTAAVADNTYGDITVSSSGTVWTINAAAVTNAKLRDSAGLSVIGRSANSAGTVADIAAASDNQVLRRSGSALGFGTVATGGIANNAVTYQKMQNCTAHHLLGRASGNGQIQEIVATAYGQSLLDDVDASAARTTLGLSTAGGDLTGSYPNPTVAARAITFSKMNLDPRTGLLCYTDCFAAQDFTSFQAGTGASVNFSFNGQTDRFGIAGCSTGTTATGRAAIGTGASNAMYLGNGLAIYRAAVKVVTLSDATDRFIVQSGWTDSTAGAPTDAARFYYTDTAGTEWQCETVSNGTSTITAVGSALVAGQWYIHEIVVNAAGTSVEFYLDGTLVATHTTDIPTGLARLTGIHTGINKTVGTTARTLEVDYILLQMDMNR
jgi:hypothetical protein